MTASPSNGVSQQHSDVVEHKPKDVTMIETSTPLATVDFVPELIPSDTQLSPISETKERVQIRCTPRLSEKKNCRYHTEDSG